MRDRFPRRPHLLRSRQKAAAMTAPAPFRPLPKNLTAELCPPDQRGACARCGATCHRFGPGGCPLCQACQATAPGVQYTHRSPAPTAG
ncbi:hypothetical protein GCM10010363_61100 [Streptomyces omiyaensis]|nr:hypothetical protein GCM10010363_61100 [Streptomyces omiyaensis]